MCDLLHLEGFNCYRSTSVTVAHLSGKANSQLDVHCQAEHSYASAWVSGMCIFRFHALCSLDNTTPENGLVFCQSQWSRLTQSNLQMKSLEFISIFLEAIFF